MGYTVTEKPTEANEKRSLASWTYKITGPKRETIESFWAYLLATETIDGYEITEN